MNACVLLLLALVQGGSTAPEPPPDLQPVVQGSGRAQAQFQNAWGQILLQRQHLLDSSPSTSTGFGALLRTSGDTAMVGHGQSAAPRHAEFFEREGGVWSLQDTVFPSLPGGDFGSGGDLSGNVAVITDYVFQDIRAFTFERSGSSWSEVSSFTVESEVVSLDGTTLAVGRGPTSSPVTVYVRDGAGWTVQALLQTNGSTGSIDLDGDLLVVGSEDDDTLGTDAGAVHVFERSGTIWTETAVLTASDAAADEHFGSHVDHEEGWIFVGNWGPNAFGFPGPDALYAFERTGSSWTEQQKLNGAANHKFGEHSSAFGPLLAVGEPDQSGGLGQVNLYVRQGSQWVLENVVSTQAPFLYLRGAYGRQVAFADHQLLIGAPSTEVGSNLSAGAVWAFEVGSTNYCTAGTSASGCQATLTALGLASSTAASGFTLSASSSEGAKAGIFFMGSNGRQATPWGSGSSFQCVTPPVTRLGLQAPGGTAGTCDGSQFIDLHAHWTSKPNANPGPGILAQAQFWYRDPQNTSNQTTSFSDAIEFFVGP